MKKIIKNVIETTTYEIEWLKVYRELRLAESRGLRPVIIIGVPVHNNIGDLAIAYAEKKFINSMKGFCAVPISFPAINYKRENLTKIVKPEYILAGHGGGNLGDTYPQEESVRRYVIEQFPENEIFIFPQTIYFSNSDFGKKFKQETVNIYSKHKKLTIVAREQVSYDTAKADFPANSVVLTPDIVLSLPDMSSDENSRKGTLLCLRADVEKVLSGEDSKKIKEFALKVSPKITETDTIADEKLFFFMNKEKIVMAKWKEFKGAQLVITDRLHGMVFAAITGTPCIVFSNFNHKVQGTHKWVKDLDYIYYCDGIGDLESVELERLLGSKKSHDPTRFEKYWSEIKLLIKSGRYE